ncbi:hypothetical protein L1785_09145 [Antribacter sp. KLBMP9083]|uniref:Uncharacterized protein n=1 Tax=Antribacter soli TaxID=2910976 RepID=A0AA41QDF7_9MICO|nr:hypothetical protein [Antribacter soli]MCF4121148.1 hypothetical protein [Antribacter soli]
MTHIASPAPTTGTRGLWLTLMVVLLADVMDLIVASGSISAMTITLIVVLAIVALCLLAVPLLPRKAADIEE